jgi:hypothetical protein
MHVIIPTRPIVEEFDLAAEPKVSNIGLGLKKIRTQTPLRDALLPKLVSGEMRISADSQIEAVT